MRLYMNPMSTYSQKALIALYEKGLSVTLQVLNLRDRAVREAYEAHYPLGRIPMLETDDGSQIPESSIIIEYLEDHYPAHGPCLIPAEREAARQVRLLDRLFDQCLNDAALTLLHMQLGIRQPDARADRKARKWLATAYPMLAQALSHHPWLAGSFSMADCAALPGLYYARQFLPFDDHPLIVDYWQRALQRPAVATTFALADQAWQAHAA